MSGKDVVQIGVEELERGEFDDVMLLKLAEHSINPDVLEILAGHSNAIIRLAVAANRHIGLAAANVLENDKDSGVVRVLVVNPTYLAMQIDGVVDISNAVIRRTGVVKPE